jgi:uncharacterized protein
MDVRQVDLGSIRGVLASPEDPIGAVAITHGAGSNHDAALLQKVATALTDARIAVLRYDLPYRLMRPVGPPPPGSATRDRDGIRLAAEWLRGELGVAVYGAGHSYGGRQTTMLAAESADVFAGLMLLSYPLHPPKKREQLRTEHFPNLRTPSQFVHGSRDPFGLPEEMQDALKGIPARNELSIFEGQGHDLKGVKGESIAAVFRSFFGL